MNHNISELSDIQSESGIIGTVIQHPEFILHTDYLKPNYFVGKENACIYWAIQELYRDGITNIDAYNISNKLQSNAAVAREIEKYNLPSIQEVLELYKETTRNTLEEYKMLVDNVISLSFKRDYIKLLKNLERKCYDSNISLDDLDSATYTDINELTEKYLTTNNEIHLLGEDIDDYWDEIVSRRSENGLYGIPSKYPMFNNYFTFEQGELVVVQAKYKKGKSILLMNEVVHKLRNGVPTLVVDTEMKTRLYVERLMAHITGISVKKIKSGNYNEQEAKKIEDCKAWIKKQPFVHLFAPNMSNEKLYSICKMLKYKMGLTFVVFDYMKSNAKKTSENYNILGAQCDFLKNMIAGELDLAVLSACQLNRQDEVADSDKINRYLSVGIKWGYKTQAMIADDGMECGNAYAKIYVNRLGEQMMEDDEKDYIDFVFSGDTFTIIEAQQHQRDNSFT